jgi:Protein of unknown function (DUF3179)
VVYDPMIEGRRYQFFVSGLLYKRNVLFYDRQTDSLWSQLLSQAVTGPMTGARLAALPAEDTSWEAWKAQHPETRVLSLVTGYDLDYGHDPYAAYPLDRSPALLVAGGGAIHIYPFLELRKASSPLTEEVGGERVTIVFDREADTARVEGYRAAAVTWFVGFLDTLKDFYPEAQVYRAKRRHGERPTPVGGRHGA